MDPQRLERVRAVSRRLVDAGQHPFSQVVVAHGGEVVLRDSYGWADVAARVPVADDSIVRFHSMTKPVTCVAAMMCYERGCFQMEEPVEIYLPEFKGMQVWDGGKLVKPRHRPNVKHLFMHTAGIDARGGPAPGGGAVKTAGTGRAGLVRRALAADDGSATPPATLAEHVRRLARAPLLFHPGERWNYSSCHTVLGRLVEVWSGVPFGEFLRGNIFAPLRMVDTGFVLPGAKARRLVRSYRVTGELQAAARQVADIGHYGESRGARGLKDISHEENVAPAPPAPAPTWRRDNGSGGLVGTIDNYYRFAQCLLDNMQGRASRGVRLLGRKTCELMTMNHSAPSQQPVWGAKGIGFGLGCAVCTDPTTAAGFCSAGEFWWGGAATTLFWVDPVEGTVCVYVTQLMPSDFYPVRVQLRVAVNQALIGPPPRTYAPSTASVTARL